MTTQTSAETTTDPGLQQSTTETPSSIADTATASELSTTDSQTGTGVTRTTTTIVINGTSDSTTAAALNSAPTSTHSTAAISPQTGAATTTPVGTGTEDVTSSQHHPTANPVVVELVPRVPEKWIIIALVVFLGAFGLALLAVSIYACNQRAELESEYEARY